MSDRPTPETDSKSGYPDDSGCWKYNDLGLYVDADFARRLERERDEALEKIKQQKLEIVRLNGATNHAGGTPLKIAIRERDDAREALRAFSHDKKHLCDSHRDMMGDCMVCSMEETK